MVTKKDTTKSQLPSLHLLLVIASIAFILVTGYTIHKNLYLKSLENPQAPTEIKNTEVETEKIEQPKPVALPETFSLTVPFTPQAPTANWDELHNEACEEASSIMVSNYFSDSYELTPKIVEAEISKLTKWQKDNLGYYLSIDTQETARMIEQVYGLQTKVTDISEETIKKALNENKLVILAANGQLLKNPYFKPPGPIYHMLVITGWDENGFITNDPGTKRGLNYKYSYNTLYKASGNWSHQNDEVDLENKKIIIVNK